MICYDSLLLEEDIPVKDDKLARRLLSTAMNGADAVLICYSRDNIDSFHNLVRWYRAVSLYLSSTTLVYLVETKNDKVNKIKDKEVAEFRKNNSISKQFSTKRDDVQGIQNMFTEIVEDIEHTIQTTKQSRLYSSPRLNTSMDGAGIGRNTNKSFVTVNSKNEKVVLLDGSYTKMPRLVTETQEDHRDAKLQSKTLTDDVVEMENLTLQKSK